MRKTPIINIATYSVLGVAAGVSFLLPQTLTIESASARPADTPGVIRLNGVVRDFPETNTDFDATLSEAPGHVAGLANSTISSSGTPAYSGSGYLVNGQAKDKSGHNIAPVMANDGKVYSGGVEFTIVNDQVVVSSACYAQVTVVGAAIKSGSTNLPVTMKVRVGSDDVSPFGSYDLALAGNVNKAGNPRNWTGTKLYPAGTSINAWGKSWNKKSSSSTGLVESHWQKLYEYNTTSATPYIYVLRNGDAVPAVPGYSSQASLATYVKDYVDVSTQKIKLAANQVIYLYELGTTDITSGAADFQDLVLVLTLAGFSDPLATTPSPCGPIDDTRATFNTTATNAGITNAAGFKSWFADTLGVNMSAVSPLDLVQQGTQYVFDDKTDPRYSKLGGFYPADGRNLGDVGSTGHNSDFSYSFDAGFTYDSSKSQFFDVTTDAEVWVFINGKLVIDLGGFHASLNQRIDLSRLCLENGKKYDIQFFLAHRYDSPASLKITTNILFQSALPQTVIAPAD